MENKYIEYKEKYTKTLLKTVSAYANFHDGEIFIGISDDGGIVGIENLDETMLAFENAINDSFDPRPFYEMEVLEKENKNVIRVKVYKGENTPYLYNNKAYVRYNTADVVADRLMLQMLTLDGSNMTYGKLKSKNENLEFGYFEKRFKSFYGINRYDKNFYITLGLFDNGNYNNAAELLSDNNKHRINIIKFDGNSVMKIKDRRIFENMSVLEQFDECMNFFRRYSEVAEDMSDVYRVTTRDVPEVAFREALVNAIAHRNYLIDSAVQVEIYDNRIEIVSPGGLTFGIDEEAFKNGRISVCRNSLIVDALIRMKLVERMGTGIMKIKEQYKNRKVKPIFEVYDNLIKIILPKESVKLKEEVARYNVDGEEYKVLRYIGENRLVSRKEIEILLGKGKTAVTNVLNNMISKGTIVKVGEGRSSRYRVNE
ncbi:MAG: putative DNA binding domain-containing protein [Clostridia bacterium]|jgi:ATP-dependent DNA helicase RecG|nr:putative DNA binding domain-containing protein [Clostridia bacterium]